MKVEVVVPEEYMAAVFGDLNSRRSAIQGTENRAGSNVIRVEVPLAQMFGYATDLRSRTQGRATFTSQIWAALMFQLWYVIFIEQKQTETPVYSWQAMC